MSHVWYKSYASLKIISENFDSFENVKSCKHDSQQSGIGYVHGDFCPKKIGLDNSGETVSAAAKSSLMKQVTTVPIVDCGQLQIDLDNHTRGMTDSLWQD